MLNKPKPLIILGKVVQVRWGQLIADNFGKCIDIKGLLVK